MARHARLNPIKQSGTDPVKPSEIRRRVGMHLELRRRRRGMHQYELAREVGIAQASVSNYETGKRDVPIGLLEPIASVLRVSVAELLPDEVVLIVREADLHAAVCALTGSPELIEMVWRRGSTQRTRARSNPNKVRIGTGARPHRLDLRPVRGNRAARRP